MQVHSRWHTLFTLEQNTDSIMIFSPFDLTTHQVHSSVVCECWWRLSPILASLSGVVKGRWRCNHKWTVEKSWESTLHTLFFEGKLRRNLAFILSLVRVHESFWKMMWNLRMTDEEGKERDLQKAEALAHLDWIYRSVPLRDRSRNIIGGQKKATLVEVSVEIRSSVVWSTKNLLKKTRQQKREREEEKGHIRSHSLCCPPKKPPLFSSFLSFLSSEWHSSIWCQKVNGCLRGGSST